MNIKHWIITPCCVTALALTCLIIAFFLHSIDIRPTDTSDLSPIQQTAVPMEENAAEDFCASERTLYWPNDKLVNQILNGNTNDAPFVSNLIVNNTETFRLVRQGLRRRTYQPLPIQYSNDPSYVMVQIAKLLALKAMQERLAGDLAQSAAICEDISHIGAMKMRNPASYGDYLYGIFITRLALDQIRVVSRLPALSDTCRTNLLQSLYPLAELDTSFIQALKSEFPRLCVSLDQAIYKEYGNSVAFRYRYHPSRTKALFAADYREACRHASLAYIYATNIPNLAPKDLSFIYDELRPNALGRRAYSQDHVLIPLLAKCRIKCYLTATQLILACQLYKHQQGELPPTLDALVPTFIKTVPQDPFDGKPFRYNPNKAILYSIGGDMIDDGGCTDYNPNIGSRIWESKDAVFGIWTNISEYYCL